jgi:dipeptidase E
MTPSASGGFTRALLVSNSGRPFLAHARAVLKDFLADVRSAAFVTAASLDDEPSYFDLAHQSLVRDGTTGVLEELQHLPWNGDWEPVLNAAEAVIVGGGNTFALLKRLMDSGMLEPLRIRIVGGLPYVGSSAGANIAGPNVLTSNDWNVVELSRFDALGVVGFNINPHYVKRGSSEAAESESRDERVAEYHLIKENPVVGLEEGGMLKIDRDVVEVAGAGSAKVFRRSQQPVWFEPGCKLENLS